MGSLRYLTHTRPDLCFVVGYLSKFMQCTKEDHLKNVKYFVRYIKGTSHYGVMYKRTQGCLIGYGDTNHLTDNDDGKSTS